MVFLPVPTDPFYELMRPPLDETPAQKTARQKREIDAQRVNDAIDEDIQRERTIIARRDKKVIKVLLLGQAESGEWIRCSPMLPTKVGRQASRPLSRVSIIQKCCRHWDSYSLRLPYEIRPR